MKVRQPQATITLYKPRPRSALGGGYTASARFQSVTQVDLTSYLADAGLRTTKSVRDPNGGSFQIVFDDKPLRIGSSNFGDSVYGLIEPMDFIEIRAAGQKTGNTLPLLMRGFVGSVTSTEDIDSGSPQRQIVVTGYDVARVLQILRVRFGALGMTADQSAALSAEFGIPFGAPALAAFEALTQFTGSQPQFSTPAQFLQSVVTNLVVPYLQKLFSGTAALAGLATIAAACDIVDGMVPPLSGAQAFDGRSVYEVLASTLDVGAFNELFVDDGDAAGLTLVARPAPWLDANNATISGGAVAEMQIDTSDLVRITQTRSDAGVSNYYWVQRSADLLNDAQIRLAGAAGDSSTFLVTDEENSSPTTFGWRLMEVSTALTNPGAAIQAPTAAGVGPRRVSDSEWLTARRLLLKSYNRDNLVFESGTMLLKGNPAIRTGMYLLLQRGLDVNWYYAVSVSHEFGQGRGYLTTVQFERGTGWLSRASSSGMPWYEWRDEGGIN